MSFLTQSHQVFFRRLLCLIPSASHVIQRLTQSLSSFRSTCPNRLNLLFLIIKLTGSNPKSSLSSLLFFLSFSLTPQHPSDHSYFSAIHLQFMLNFHRPAVYCMKFLQVAQIWLSVRYGGVIIMSLDGVRVTGSNTSHFTFFWQLWAHCLHGHIRRSPTSSVWFWPKTGDVLGLVITDLLESESESSLLPSFTCRLSA